MPPKKGLGRGLEALLPGISSLDGEGVTEIPTDEVTVNPYQPRQRIDAEKLEELVQSVREHGVIQPIIVRRRGKGYELVAGERRWRAACKAGLKMVPAVVKELDDAKLMEIALIENLQREDLNPIEQAVAYRTLMTEFRLTQQELSKRLAKSRAQIANTVRLLNLSAEVREFVAAGELSMGHAKVLLGLEGDEQKELARRIRAEGLSVRETERIAEGLRGRGRAQGGAGKGRKKAAAPAVDPEILRLEEELRGILGTRVAIKPGRRKGRIEIEYYGGEDLERILEIIMGGGLESPAPREGAVQLP